MRIRAHRALLEDAIKAMKEIEPTKRAVYEYFLVNSVVNDLSTIADWWSRYNVSDIEVKPYYYDSRIGWDTHIVTLKGDAIGFTDGPLKDL